MNDAKIKKMTTVAMLCAAAYVVMLIGRIPVVLFLKYDPKDVVIAIGGFVFGPLTAFTISALVGLVEMFTASETGIIGLVMNIISSCSFACTAAFIYKKAKNIKGAVIGLAAGVAVMATVMLLWNYLITPLYMDIPREEVVPLLTSAILPFNLLKGCLNSAIVFLIYKPIVKALRKADLLPPSSSAEQSKSRVGAILITVVVLITCIMAVLVMKEII